MAAIGQVYGNHFGAVPVQIEGTLKDGRFFYFRSRHETARLSVHRGSTDAAVRVGCGFAEGFDVGAATVTRDLSHLGKYQAGCLDTTEALALLHELAAELPDDDSAAGIGDAK